MSNLDMDPEKLKTLFREVGLYNPNGEFYNQRIHKHQQVLSYITQINSAMKKLSTKRPIVMLDCGCGKSYLSFVIYEYCKNVLNRKIKIFGVDNNKDLIDKCNQSAQALGFEHMHFYHTTAGAFVPEDDIDIVYSLHACNTATDQTIAQGILHKARYIFSVSCCQHDNRRNLCKHDLKSISRHQPYKERLVDMIGDSMRALILEHFGYGVSLFEFIAAEYTPKNIMLKATINTAKKYERETAMENYRKLVDMFHFTPALESMLALKR